MPFVGSIRRVEIKNVTNADGTAVVGAVVPELRIEDSERVITYVTLSEDAPTPPGRNWHYDVTLTKPNRWHFTIELTGAIQLIAQDFVDVDPPYVENDGD